MGIITDFIDNRIERKELSEMLNTSNIHVLKKKEIRIMGRDVSPVKWDEHKKRILISWMKSKDNFEHKHQNKAKKFLKILELERDEQIDKLLLSLERREFTTRRAFKIIEAPFDKEGRYKGKNALLVYKSVKLYDNSKSFMRLITNSDLYIFKDKIVWYDQKQKKIIAEFNNSLISDIVLFDYGLEALIDGKKMIIRYKDNHIIRISLDRILEKNNINSMDLTREVKLVREIKKEDI